MKWFRNKKNTLYSRIRLIQHRKGPEKTCRITRIVVLAGVNIINKHSKGLKIQCRYRRIVALAGVVLAGFYCIIIQLPDADNRGINQRGFQLGITTFVGTRGVYFIKIKEIKIK